MKVINIAIVTNIISVYREGFYNRLFSCNNIKVKVYCQDKIPGTNFRTIHQMYINNVKLVKYLSAPKEKIVWQFLPWKEILSDYDVVFIDGNPRNLSHVVLSILLKLCKKNIILSTMAHSYKANKLFENIRLLWTRMFHNILVYNDSDVKYLIKKGFKKHFIVAQNNGLDQKNIEEAILQWPEIELNNWRTKNNFKNKIILLSCARLESKNRFSLMVQALPMIIKEFPNITWCIIGAGPQEEQLKSLVNSLGLSEYVVFAGEMYAEKELAPWFLAAEIFIHPAAIGLSLLHAFGYGLPVVTHNKSEYHGPEYSAFEPEETGRNFNEGDVNHLAITVKSLLRDDESRSIMKINAQNIVREKYNSDIMVERFVRFAYKIANSQN